MGGRGCERLMIRTIWLSTIAVCMAVTAGCAFTAPVTCPQGEDVEPLTCDVAITAVRAELAGSSGITELRFAYGGYCPPAAHCQVNRAGTRLGHVVVERGEEDPLLVILSVDDDGRIVVSDPEALPGT
jgi:hypothetical protein